MNDSQSLGTFLKNARLESGYEKISYLAKESGVPQSTISRLEADKQDPSLETLRKLSRCLNVSYFQLMLEAGYLDERTFGSVLTKLRLKNGYVDIASFAEISGLKQEDLLLLENNQREANEHELELIASALGIDVNDLIIARGDLSSIMLFGAPISRPGKNKQTNNTLPILGDIRPRLPLLSHENYNGMLRIPNDISADYVLQVAGDSMIGVGIMKGDYAVCKQAHDAHSGQIVVAIKDQDAGFSEVTLKYYFNNGHAPVLRAANPSYPELNMKDGFRIAGVMVGLLRKELPPYNEYQNNIAGHGEWHKVIQNAINSGLSAKQLDELVNIHIEMAKKFSIKK